MHKEQCIGPGRAKSLVVSSVFQWQRLSTDPLLQAVGDGRREEGRKGRKGREVQAWRSGAISWTVLLSLSLSFSSWERERGQARTGRRCERGCTDTKCGDLSVFFFFSFLCRESGLLCAVFNFLNFFLKDQSTAEPFPTHNRPGEKWAL